MAIDVHWLDEEELTQLSQLNPSSAWGAELMREVWPKRYTPDLSSDTYRGCASVLAMLGARMRAGISVADIQALVDDLDQSLKVSPAFQSTNDLAGGASLTIVNAWTTAAEMGFTAAQIAAAYESELIYAAKMFIQAKGA